MAKVKAKSPKSVGLYDRVRGFFTPDKGTIADKLKNRDRDIDAAVKKQTSPKVKKADTKPKYKAGTNKKIKQGQDKLRKKSTSQIEAIRKRLQAGETVKVDET